jgi:hypothetical protein
MLQKPPVVFAQYNPAEVIRPSELAVALRSRREDAVTWLWLSYSRTVLDDVDSCMEANEGAGATLALASRYPGLSHMEVRRVGSHTYEMRLAGAGLYLSGTDDGDVFLYFFSPEKNYNRREECRIDLTDYGCDAAAYFIDTVFSAYKRITNYYETNRQQ